MRFKTYFLSLPVENPEAPLDRERFARRCGTTRNHLTKVAHGFKPASAALAIAIERESGGLVQVEEVRRGRSARNPHGEDWQFIRGTAKRRQRTAAACNA